jgi:thiazole/oxazole-forming peptide maturase SagD family component
VFAELAPGVCLWGRRESGANFILAWTDAQLHRITNSGEVAVLRCLMDQTNPLTLPLRLAMPAIERLTATGILAKAASDPILGSSDTRSDDLTQLLIDGLEKPQDFGTILASNYSRADLDVEITSRALDGFWSIPVKPIGEEIWVGPAISPHDLSVWRGIRRRLSENLGPVPESVGVGAPFADGEARRVFRAASREMVDQPDDWADQIIVINTATGARRLVPLRIGTLSIAEETAIDVPVFGLCEPMVDMSASDDAPVRTWATVLNKRDARPGVDFMRRSIVCVGNGATAEDARRKARGEVVERHAAASMPGGGFARARIDDLDGKVIEPNSIQLFGPEQLRDRVSFNAMVGGFHHIPEPFDPSQSIEWCIARSLGSGPDAWVPAGLVQMRHPDPNAGRFFKADSVGCAAGPTLNGAILRALLELIERDAFALWWYGRCPLPDGDVDPGTADLHERVKRWLEGRGRDLRLIEVDTGLGGRTVIALSATATGGEIVFGSAGDMTLHGAQRRAILELMQSVARAVRWTDTVQPDDPNDRLYENWMRSGSYETEPFLALSGQAVTRDDARHGRRVSAEEALDYLVGGLTNQGLEAYAIDMTRPDVGIPVARVIVPGLRSPWRRTASGRLFDTPVALGWLREPRTVQTLNRHAYWS